MLMRRYTLNIKRGGIMTRCKYTPVCFTILILFLFPWGYFIAPMNSSIHTSTGLNNPTASMHHLKYTLKPAYLLKEETKDKCSAQPSQTALRLPQAKAAWGTMQTTHRGVAEASPIRHYVKGAGQKICPLLCDLIVPSKIVF